MGYGIYDMFAMEDGGPGVWIMDGWVHMTDNSWGEDNHTHALE